MNEYLKPSAKLSNCKKSMEDKGDNFIEMITQPRHKYDEPDGGKKKDDEGDDDDDEDDDGSGDEKGEKKGQLIVNHRVSIEIQILSCRWEDQEGQTRRRWP